ncbi:isopeptide-forming domain-containing fimbrial protein [Aeromicrobium phragmitis]|uniref:Isopeptide-forming domain-containing fimbrial protein n=1 Tax=Aeromicrobium phragmitis TaxID=2478914 RepID=A0A3L8PU35_9ACTN|nr:DUF5979 domain-containing protein [Aeromicrobium phragmitis]RLV57542.1 isopeptide-forming domain-containing fimbrial protein [Aeromicrobium phragmitis]
MPRERSFRRSVLLVLAAVTALITSVMGPSVVATAAAQPVDEPGKAFVNVTKGNDFGGQPLHPGDEFSYTFVVQCSSLEVDCVNFTFTDVLPEGLDITALPQSNSTRTVTFDEATRTLTIVYQQVLQAPVGATGLTAGATQNFTVGMRLPTDTTIADGTTISNTATVTADNADPAESTNDITVEVPKVVRPVATKSWTDGSAVAGSDEKSTAVLGVRNSSSSSARVDELTITDAAEATFEHFDLTDVELSRFPAGADQARLEVLTGGAWVPAGTVTATGQLALPGGVSAGDVTGVRVVFTNSAGAPLPYDATGGEVRLGLQLRETYRSSGEPLRPQGRVRVDNCVEPTAVEGDGTPVVGAAACAGYDILPDVLVLDASKTFFPDANKNFQHDRGEYAVIGENSRSSARIDVRQRSPFPVKEIVITEPSANPDGEFSKIDVDTIRLRFPNGATNATVRVTYDNAPATTTDYDPSPATQVIDVAKDGSRVTGVVVTYTGEKDGEPSIRTDATAGLDISGHLNDLVTDADLADGTSPFVVNCYGYSGTAGRTDGTGTTSGSGCANLTVEKPRSGGEGNKSVGQTEIPPGQPVPFTLRYTNNGNIPLVDPVITDPAPEAGGIPPSGLGNPFSVLRLTDARVSGSNAADTAIEIYDPQVSAWVAYDGASDEVVERSIGVRAVMTGELLPTQSFTLSIVTQRRDGVDDDVTLDNCFVMTADGYVGAQPSCSPRISTKETRDAATITKSITPSVLPRPIPGLAPQHSTARLQASNSGNLSMSQLRLIDANEEFFDAVNFVDFATVKFPAGANRVTIDALVDGTWVEGSPRDKAVLPDGVAAKDVVGIRATFTHSSGEYRLTPCADANQCGGEVSFRFGLRETLRSDADVAVPDDLINELHGEYVTRLQDPEDPRPVDPTRATVTVSEGDAQLSVEKTPNSSLAPGEVAPFRLKVTNTGTSNITDLVVKDALPAGLQLDETFVGDGGQPFRIIDVQVPEGTEDVPTPALTLTRDGERVNQADFDFSVDEDGKPWLLRPGTTFTIEIQVMLAPGVTAGEVVVNTMGATGNGPNFTCGGESQNDGSFGEGLYCTDTAHVTVKAGAAFTARKWVAGNPERGWYDTRARQGVPVGDASCPTVTDANGVQYTSHPCIALVDPGDQFQYLLRVVNAGTESGTNMRIVDVFPAKGDRGVWVDQNRGTQWDQRPTLATEPVLNGPGSMTTSYTQDADVCTDDLRMGGAGSSAPECPASAWEAQFGPDVTASKFDIAFDEPLAPGQGIEVAYAMTTPLDVEQVADPTIAWNSFAHAETTLRGNGLNVMPPTEPIKVGVGTAYGALEITKLITDNPYDLPVDERAFPVHVTCEIEPIGGTRTTVVDEDYEVTPGEPVTVTAIPAGADCRVWETDALGGQSSATEENPVRVTIEPGLGSASVAQVEIENSYAPASLTLDKSVTGTAAGYAPTTFEADLFCSVDGQPVKGFDPLSVTIDTTVDDGRVTVDVPPGADCRAVETETGGATEVVYSGTAETESGQPATIAIENQFRSGGLKIAKELAGPGAPSLAGGPFSFDVRCSFHGREDVFTDTVTLQGDGATTLLESEVLDGLPVGADCVVTETDAGGADQVPDPVTVTIPDEVDGEAQVVVAGLTNVFSAGTIAVHKELAGDGADEAYATDAEFTVLLRCEREVEGVRTTVYSGEIALRGGDTITVLGTDGEPLRLPLGTHCFGEETVTGGATTSVVDHDSYEDAAVVAEGEELQELTITATNTFDLTDLAVSKELAGAGRDHVGDKEFTVAVTCVLDQGRGEPTVIVDAEEHRISGGETIRVEGLPVGADCWAEETETGGAAQVQVEGGTIAEPAVLTADEDNAITVTNTFAAVPSGDLPNNGGPTWWYLLAGMVLVALGGGITTRRLARR